LPRGTEWKLLQLQGELINPCDSPLHPSVREAKIKPSAEEKPIQQSYAGESHCFGCGPHNPDGLQLKSYRIKNGLSAKVILQNKWMCFPGIASGGIITTLFDCHGNWTAAISLMDKQCLPRPPLTLTSEMLVNFRAPTPADEELVVRSQVVAIRDKDKLPPGVKPQVLLPHPHMPVTSLACRHRGVNVLCPSRGRMKDHLHKGAVAADASTCRCQQVVRS